MVRILWKKLQGWLASINRSLLGRALLTVLLVGPAVAFIGYQTWRNWDQLRQYPWQLQPGLWGVGFVGYSASLLCLLSAWSYMMARLGGITRFRTNARLYMVSGLSKRLPGFIWYMAGRALFYQQQGVPPSISLTSSSLELALMATSGLVAYLLTLPFGGSFLEGTLGLAAAGGLLVAGVVLLQPAVFNRLFGFFLRRLGSRTQVQIAYRDILPIFPLYVLAWGIGGATLYALICSVYPLPLPMLPAVIAISAGSGALTLLISTFLFGLGVREVALSILLATLMPQPLAVVVTLLFSLLMAVGELLWTGLFVLWR